MEYKRRLATGLRKGSDGRHLLVTLMALVPAGVGCSTSAALAVSKFQPPYRIEVHAAGKVVLNRTVPPGSSDETEVSRWVQTHSAGWRPTYATYAPVRRIRGNGFDLNFQKGLCVLSYQTNSRETGSRCIGRER